MQKVIFSYIIIIPNFALYADHRKFNNLDQRFFLQTWLFTATKGDYIVTRNNNQPSSFIRNFLISTYGICVNSVIYQAFSITIENLLNMYSMKDIRYCYRTFTSSAPVYKRLKIAYERGISN